MNAWWPRIAIKYRSKAYHLIPFAYRFPWRKRIGLMDPDDFHQLLREEQVAVHPGGRDGSSPRGGVGRRAAVRAKALESLPGCP